MRSCAPGRWVRVSTRGVLTGLVAPLGGCRGFEGVPRVQSVNALARIPFCTSRRAETPRVVVDTSSWSPSPHPRARSSSGVVLPNWHSRVGRLRSGITPTPRGVFRYPGRRVRKRRRPGSPVQPVAGGAAENCRRRFICRRRAVHRSRELQVRKSRQRVLLEARDGGQMINVMLLVIVLAAARASVCGPHRIGRGAVRGV